MISRFDIMRGKKLKGGKLPKKKSKVPTLSMKYGGGEANLLIVQQCGYKNLIKRVKKLGYSVPQRPKKRDGNS